MFRAEDIIEDVIKAHPEIASMGPLLFRAEDIQSEKS